MPSSLPKQALDEGFRSLRFQHPSLEKEFQQYFFDTHFRAALLPLFCGLALYLAFAFADQIMLPNLFDRSLLIRLAITIPSLFFLLYLKLCSYSRLHYLLAMGILVLVNVSIDYLGYYAALQGQHYYQSGTLLAIMLACTLANLPFYYAVLTTALMLLSYTLIIGVTNASPADFFYNHLFVFCGVAFLGLVSNYQQNYNIRKNFLHSKLINAENASLSREKMALEHISNIDQLTNLYNRRFLNEEYANLWQEAFAQHHPISVLMIDIDHFKQLNDLSGHHKGDEVLAEVANALAKNVRKSSDIVARYGGEEFMVVCPGLSASASFRLAEKLRKAIIDLSILHPAGHFLSVSVGLASCTPETPLKTEQAHLQKAADLALYQAKQKGRNRVSEANLNTQEANETPQSNLNTSNNQTEFIT